MISIVRKGIIKLIIRNIHSFKKLVKGPYSARNLKLVKSFRLSQIKEYLLIWSYYQQVSKTERFLSEPIS